MGVVTQGYGTALALTQGYSAAPVVGAKFGVRRRPWSWRKDVEVLAAWLRRARR